MNVSTGRWLVFPWLPLWLFWLCLVCSCLAYTLLESGDFHLALKAATLLLLEQLTVFFYHKHPTTAFPTHPLSTTDHTETYSPLLSVGTTRVINLFLQYTQDIWVLNQYETNVQNFSFYVMLYTDRRTHHSGHTYVWLVKIYPLDYPLEFRHHVGTALKQSRGNECNLILGVV